MKSVKLLIALVTGAMLMAPPSLARQEEQAKEKVLSVDALLEQVRSGHRQDNEINQQRLAEFRQGQAQQETLLKDTQRQRSDAEALSARQEAQFEQNEQQILLMQERLSERLGSLKELFGVLQLVANDAQGQFDNSLVQIHYPQRSATLNAFSEKMGQTTVLPTIAEIESLWFELQREMTESGKLVQSKHPVLMSNGEEKTVDVLRVGTFNLVAEQQYVQRISETGRIVAFPRQPGRRYMDGANTIMDAQSGELVPFTVDPIRGQLIALQSVAPGFSERVQQGGVIGYVIISLGVVVFLIALVRYLALWNEDRQITAQLGALDKPGNNPLGRLLRVYQDNKGSDIESLELKLGEAVLREVPHINRGLSFIKISAAIAPLLGLLGTVSGMIITFQAITLFGAGDPKLMAGGISQALVTTVLGLTVAIPTLLLHNLVSSRATKMRQIIEQEAVALVAVQASQDEPQVAA